MGYKECCNNDKIYIRILNEVIYMKIHKNKDFILLVVARLLINFADSLFYIVAIWYTSKTLESTYYTSIATFLFLLPETVLIFIGPIVDRVNPKKILLSSLCTQLGLLMIVVVFWNKLSIVMLLIAIFISSFMSNITYPIEESIIPQIVKTEELVAANSILSVTYKIFDSIFNGTSGFLLVAFSTVSLLKINLIAFLLPLFVVWFIKFTYEKSDEEYNIKNYFKDLKEGAVFIKSSELIYILAPLIFVNFFNAVNGVVLPFFSQQYKNAAETFGMIMAIKGVGGIVGAIIINHVKKVLPTGKLLSVLLILNGVFWICFIFTGGTFISYVFVFVSYMFFGMYNIIYSSLFQAITPIKLMGRVLSSVDTIIAIAMPIGALFGGVILKVLPCNISMMFSAISVIITGIFYYKVKIINSLPYIDDIKRLNIDKVNVKI